MGMRKGVIIAFLLLWGVAGIAAGNTLQKSDKMVPHWVKHTPKSENPNMAYRVVQVYVDKLSDAHEASLKDLTNYMPQSWEINRFAEWQVNGNGSNEVKVLMEGSPVAVSMDCKEVDSYWELVQMGYKNQYRCYVLYQVVRPGTRAIEYTRLTNKYGFGPVALSLFVIPGAGQMYKGSYLKGGLIMGASVICAGGIVLCEATRASYVSLSRSTHDATQIKTYTNKANNWQTGSWICIGASVGIWIYSIIDAGVAPGARRMVIDNKFKGYSLNLAPTMFDPYTPGLTARVTF